MNLFLFVYATSVSVIMSEASDDTEVCDIDNVREKEFYINDSEWYNAMSESREQTFIMIKPDGVQRGLVGEIISRFERKGFKLIAMKFMWPSTALLEKHYSDLASRPFFPGLIKYMSSGPVVPMVWEGLNVVKTARTMMGATDPKDSAPGTIRGDLSIQVGRNVIHGSDSVESANKEISLWFKPDELTNWKREIENWIYEN